ncbi:MAG: hypothetical protein ACREVO_06345 [Steroidobacteraceae bacterium]
MRLRPGFLLVLGLVLGLPLADCELLDDTPPQQLPSVIAARYVGRPLLDLEMKWSEPLELSRAGDGQKATWSFDGYNLAGCRVTVRTDAAEVIRELTWTPGCGPKGTGTAVMNPERPED